MADYFLRILMVYEEENQDSVLFPSCLNVITERASITTLLDRSQEDSLEQYDLIVFDLRGEKFYKN
jgi:hypothetical protein